MLFVRILIIVVVIEERKISSVISEEKHIHTNKQINFYSLAVNMFSLHLTLLLFCFEKFIL